MPQFYWYYEIAGEGWYAQDGVTETLIPVNVRTGKVISGRRPLLLSSKPHIVRQLPVHAFREFVAMEQCNRSLLFTTVILIIAFVTLFLAGVWAFISLFAF